MAALIVFVLLFIGALVRYGHQLILWVGGGLIFAAMAFGAAAELPMWANPFLWLCTPAFIGMVIVTSGRPRAPRAQARPPAAAFLQPLPPALPAPAKKRPQVKTPAPEAPSTGPMLAKNANQIDPRFPALVQPKLNGERCRAVRKKDGVHLFSRPGNPITLPHISQALAPLMQPGEVFDGELYHHGTALGRIESLIKRPRPASEQLQLHVFDCEGPGTAAERQARLDSALAGPLPASIARVMTTPVDNQAELDALHQQHLSLGFEGSIWRDPSAIHSPGYSRSVLKLKPRHDAEFEIIGVLKGKARVAGGKAYNLAVYQCQTASGERFKVLADGTYAQKHKAWLQRKARIGQWLKVSFRELSDAGIPQEPTALGLREAL